MIVHKPKLNHIACQLNTVLKIRIAPVMWMGGESEGEWTRVHMAESLHCSPGSNAILLIGYIPRQYKKLKKNLSRHIKIRITSQQFSRSGIRKSGIYCNFYKNTSLTGLGFHPYEFF